MTNVEYLDNVVAKYGHRVFAKWNQSIDDDNIYIGRGSIYGNPIPLLEPKDFEQRVICAIHYRNYLADKIKDPAFVQELLKLDTKNVVCFCSNGTSHRNDGAKYCHGHVLLSAVASITNK